MITSISGSYKQPMKTKRSFKYFPKLSRLFPSNFLNIMIIKIGIGRYATTTVNKLNFIVVVNWCCLILYCSYTEKLEHWRTNQKPSRYARARGWYAPLLFVCYYCFPHKSLNPIFIFVFVDKIQTFYSDLNEEHKKNINAKRLFYWWTVTSLIDSDHPLLDIVLDWLLHLIKVCAKSAWGQNLVKNSNLRTFCQCCNKPGKVES